MRSRGESGQVLPLIAICLTVIMGSAGMSVDVGYLEYHQRQQQSAADAAALGAAQQLVYSGCPNLSAAQTAADSDSASNGFTTGTNNVTVLVNNPPATGPYAGNSCAVSIQVQASKTATFFTRLFGLNGAETTQAVGLLTANNTPPTCFLAESTTVSSTFNGTTVTAPGCGILINDTATFNGDPKFDAESIGFAGGAPIENGTTFTAATPAPMLKVADPCPEIAGCAYLAANPPPTTGCKTLLDNGLSNVTIQPGCYNSFTLNGDTNVTFEPGVYVFNGSTTINGTTGISGDGVTLYVSASGTPPTFNGTGVNLSPPTTGPETGVLYYQVPSNTNSPTFNGASMQLGGLIYAPGATQAIFNGTNGGYLLVVVGAATLNGGAAYDLATPPPGQSLIKQAVLAQ